MITGNKSNFERMIEMAQQVFNMKDDFNQLQVDESVIQKLIALHPSSVVEINYGNGPVLWLLIIPTQTEIMKRFINGNINESEIFSETENTKPFTTIYLCSIMVLEEYRNKGLAFKTSINTIQSIKESNPIESLFVWPFTAEGKLLAEKIATHLSLKIFFKNNKAR